MNEPVKRRAVVTGWDRHAQKLASLVNTNGGQWRLQVQTSSARGMLAGVRALAKADALISFGGVPHALFARIATARGIPIHIIWGGTDVVHLRHSPHQAALLRQRGYLHHAVSPWLVDELRDVGIEASELPVAGMRVDQVMQPFPHHFRVLTYLPEPRRDFYGKSAVYEIASTLPQVEFLVVGQGAADPAAPANVRYLGERPDISSIIDESCVLLRLPQHDGMSVLVLEAMSRGRHVVWTYQVPGVVRVSSADAAAAAIKDLLRKHADGTLQFNAAGIAHAQAHFAAPTIASGIERVLDEGQRQHAVRSPHEGDRPTVAISGLEFFIAEIFGRASSQTGWRHRFLSFRSRIDALASLWTVLTSDVWYTLGAPYNGRLFEYLTYALRKPRVMHWAGTDVLYAKAHPRLLKRLRKPQYTHVAEFEGTASELAALGLNARIAPLPARLRNFPAPPPLPERFTVLLYVPGSRKQFYGGLLYEQLIASVANEPIHFLIVGGGSLDVAEGARVENLGWQYSLEDVYPRISVLVRCTEHDGLSLMVLEALKAGRHVLWSQEFPFVRHVDGYQSLELQVRELFQLHRDGKLVLQGGASEYVSARYDYTRCLRDLEQIWRDAAGRFKKGARSRMLSFVKKA